MQIHKLFPETVAQTEISVANTAELVKTLVWRTDSSLQGDFDQSQTDLQLLPIWQPVVGQIVASAEYFWRTLGYRAEDFWIPQMWANRMRGSRPHNTIASHSHSNSLISGCLHLVVTEASGGTVIEHNRNRLETHIQTVAEQITEYNTGEQVFPARTNQLLLWPSYLQHRSEPNHMPQAERITVAFNILPRTLGIEQHYNWARFSA